jgi:hypothetical protein
MPNTEDKIIILAVLAENAFVGIWLVRLLGLGLDNLGECVLRRGIFIQSYDKPGFSVGVCKRFVPPTAKSIF